jgi:hypothetical protein
MELKNIDFPSSKLHEKKLLTEKMLLNTDSPELFKGENTWKYSKNIIESSYNVVSS